MRLYDILSVILLILPTIEFAVAMPVPVQEKPQLPVGTVTPVDTMTMLRNRGDEFDMEELSKLILSYGQNPDSLHENPFKRPKKSSAARPSSSSPSPSLPPSKPLHLLTNAKQPLPSIPENYPGEDALMEEDASGPGASSLAKSTMSDSHPELVGAHALPNKGPSTESDHLLTGMDAPLSSAVYPSWFHLDHGLMRAHVPQPNLGLSNPRPSTEFDSGHRFVVEEPPSLGLGSPTELDMDHEYHVVHPPPISPGSESPTEFDHDMEIVDLPPSGRVSSTNPGRRSMIRVADSNCPAPPGMF